MVAFIEAFRDQFGVEPMCRALRQAGVAISPSGYYAARARPLPARALGDAALEKQILRVYKDSKERYGAWKVWDQLNREGIAAARCTVERLMRKLGLRGVRRGGYKVRTTRSDPAQDRPEDLVNRDFAPDAPDRLWVVDFTFVSTWAGTAYTAFVIDAFARLITGWRTAASHSTDLVLDALVMAVTYRARQGVKVAGLTHHSDAGSEYLSIRYGAELVAAGIAPSVGSVGDSYDNALAESIIGLYKAEVIDHLGPWETPAQVEAATSEWASWYNTARVMRRTGGRPQAEYEQAWRDGTLGRVPARGPGSRPRRPPEGGGHGRRSLPRRAAPAPAGAPPRTPALLRDGLAGQDGCGGGRASPRRPRDGCHGTPAQVKGASGVASDDAARHPCPARGTRGAKRVPDEEMPEFPPGGGLAAEPATRRGSWTAQLDRCSTKQKRKMIRPWFRQAAVPWKTTATQTRASGENRVSTKPGVLHVLGPLEVRTSSGWTAIGAPKQRAVLAALVLAYGEVVPTERLVDELWGTQPPPGARKLVSRYVMQVRRLAGDPDGQMLVTRSPGYQLLMAPDQVDARRFEEALAAGGTALGDGDAMRAGQLLREGLALWRGPALADVPPGMLVTAEADRLDELRLAAVELRVEADLAAGGAAAGLAAELRALLAEHPLRGAAVVPADAHVVGGRSPGRGAGGLRAGPAGTGRGTGRRSRPPAAGAFPAHPGRRPAAGRPPAARR